jgi:hypothetical protein
MQADMIKAGVAKAELLKQQPRFTIGKLRGADSAHGSPAFSKRAETHLYPGLRKAGILE